MNFGLHQTVNQRAPATPILPPVQIFLPPVIANLLPPIPPILGDIILPLHPIRNQGGAAAGPPMQGQMTQGTPLAQGGGPPIVDQNNNKNNLLQLLAIQEQANNAAGPRGLSVTIKSYYIG